MEEPARLKMRRIEQMTIENRLRYGIDGNGDFLEDEAFG